MRVRDGGDKHLDADQEILWAQTTVCVMCMQPESAHNLHFVLEEHDTHTGGATIDNGVKCMKSDQWLPGAKFPKNSRASRCRVLFNHLNNFDGQHDCFLAYLVS